MSNIETLVADIQGLFDGHGFSEAIDKFSSDLGEAFKKRFQEYTKEREPTLRLSNYGRPLRQLWYELNRVKPDTSLPASAKFKFLYGDVLESLLLLLAHEAGHDVRDFQREVEVDGIKGHIDCTIDGILIDCKSASTFSFNKFRSGGIRNDDPFGYIPQLAAYSLGLGGLDGGFLVVDKTLGNIHLERFSKEELASFGVRERIAKDKEIQNQAIPPERCYPDVPFQKSGNMKLGVGCSYCSYKKTCWSDCNDGVGLREFHYSTGPVWLTKVVKEPRVAPANAEFEANEN